MSELQEKLGKLLQMERQRRDMSLEDLAVELKTSEAYLEYIEAGDISSLPSELYFNLFSKSYAETLGIDYVATVEAIEADLNGLEDEEPEQEGAKGKPTATPVDRGESEEPSGKGPLKKLGYTFGFVLLVFVCFLIINKIFLTKADEPGADNMTSHVEETTTDEGPTSGGDDLAGYDWDVPRYEEPSEMTLRLRARTECWSAVIADGDTVIFRTLVPDKDYVAVAKYRLSVSVGVPSTVSIDLNGQTVDLTHPESGRIYKVVIDQLNLKEILAGRWPSRDQIESQPPNEQSSGETAAIESEVPASATASAAVDSIGDERPAESISTVPDSTIPDSTVPDSTGAGVSEE